MAALFLRKNDGAVAMSRNYKSVVAATAGLLVAIALGIGVATFSESRSPFNGAFGWASSATAILDSGENARIEPNSSEADPNIEFPKDLSELPNPPTQLAIDPKNGDLWFVMFTYDGSTNDLYHYVVSDGTVDKRSIPASTGSEFFSAIAVDSRGHVISAEGDIVLDIDPAGGYRELSLTAPVNVSKQQGWDGTYVIDMAVSKDDKAYLTRMNTAGVTELDIRTGVIREISVPPSLGQFYFIELAGGELWMTTWADTAVAPSQTAVLDLENGQTSLVGAKSVAFGADGKGGVYASTQGSGGLSRVDSKSAPVESVLADSDALSGLRDYVAIDKARGRVWMAGGVGIASLEPSTGDAEYYRLPAWSDTAPLSVPAPCLIQDCDLTSDAVTFIGGIAVAPSGDLFFADKSFNRIGVIHPR